MESFLIRPREPTILANEEFYELLPTDLWLQFSIEVVYVVPGEIDVERFNDALSRTLSVYPLAAGRIEKPTLSDLPWKIRLTNSPVPVTVIDSNETQIFPIDSVLQNPGRFVQIVDTKNIKKASPHEPLLQVTLTRFVSLGQTGIGLSSSHVISDGSTIARFSRLLSQNYQGLEALDPVPCYQRITPAQASILYMSGDLDIPFPLSAPKSQMDPTQGQSLVQVNFRFASTQLGSIRQGVIDELDKTNSSNLMFSRADVIIALVALSLAQADTPPVDHLSLIVNHRGMGVALETVVCNAIAFLPIEPFPELHDKSTRQALTAIITQIRNFLTCFRQIDNLSTHLAQMTAFMRQPGFIERADELQISTPGHMLANSLWRCNWTFAHFGYPNQTRFHHIFKLQPRQIGIYTPNPTLSSDGKTWETRSGDFEVALCIDEDVKEKFEKTLRDNARALGMLGEVEFV